MVNTPIPTSLKSEIKKASKILREFTIPSAKVGPDKLIPAGLVSNAAGLCILTVAKVGFLVTARGGSGIVIAKKKGGGWTAPSAIGIAGLGGGLEIGAEVTDFIIILNKWAAVQAFSKGGNLTLGGNFTIAAGPLGRNLEGDVSLRSTAAIYTYSRTKGLFAGISIEGSGLIERKDANKNFYGRAIRAYEILDGDVEPPPGCDELYEVLELHDAMFHKAALAYAKRRAVSEAKKTAAGGAAGIMAKVKSIRGSTRSNNSTSSSNRRKSSHGDSSTSDPVESSSADWYDNQPVCDSSDEEVESANFGESSSRMRRSQSSYGATSSTSSSTSGFYSAQSTSSDDVSCGTQRGPKKSRTYSGSETQSLSAESAWDKPPTARAIWDFNGQMPCDLMFKQGDEIEIITRSGTQDDWWEGKLRGRVGIFPANYVEVMSFC